VREEDRERGYREREEGDDDDGGERMPRYDVMAEEEMARMRPARIPIVAATPNCGGEVVVLALGKESKTCSIAAEIKAPKGKEPRDEIWDSQMCIAAVSNVSAST
jgi:hypothetical protein